MVTVSTTNTGFAGPPLLPLSFPERQRVSCTLYHQMAEASLLDADVRVELLNGEIVPMSPVGYPHGGVVDDLNEFFGERRRGRFRVRVQNPHHASEYSEPEPDLQLLKNSGERFHTRHPGPDDVLLLVEVAESSLAKDLGPKMQIYAAAGIVEYWVIDLVNRRVAVHTDPDTAAAMYRSVVFFGDTEQVAPRCADDCAIDLAWLFGPRTPDAGA